MAHLDRQDVELLWRALPDKSWEGLRQAVREHTHRIEWIDERIADIIIKESSELQQGGQSFPSSQQELSELLNGRLAGKDTAA